MLVLIVVFLVVVDIGIMTIYTGLEIGNMGGASRVVNKEREETVSGVSSISKHACMLI